MNKRNNKRSQKSIEAIQKAFLQVAQDYPKEKITVQRICQVAQVNRTTFYAHYLDIFDLSEKVQQKMYTQISEIILEELQKNTQDIPRAFEAVFNFIKENGAFYSTLLKNTTHGPIISIVDQQPLLTYLYQAQEQLGYPKEEMGYHITFFISGLNAVIRYWINKDYKESPTTMARIIQQEARLHLAM